MNQHPGWTVTRVAGVEVFTAPDGAQYVHAPPQSATVTMAMAHGTTLYLRPRSAEQILKATARKARRLARRADRRIVNKMEDV